MPPVPADVTCCERTMQEMDQHLEDLATGFGMDHLWNTTNDDEVVEQVIDFANPEDGGGLPEEPLDENQHQRPPHVWYYDAFLHFAGRIL